MDRREKRIRRGRPTSSGARKLFTPIIHHRVIASEARQSSSIITTRAFTLIELLVVISILAMLMAILLPTLGRVRKQMKAVACQAKLRQWGQIFKMYTDTNEGRWFRREGGGDPWFIETFSLWYESPSIALCPMTARMARTSPGVWDAFTVCRAKAYLGRSPTGTRVYGPFSYGFNEAHLCWERSVDPTKDWASCWQTCDVRGAASIPVFFDSAYPAGCGDDRHGPPPNPWITEGIWYPMCIDRHDGGINVLFLDWSVRKVGLKELWTLQWHRGYDTANAWTGRGGVVPEDWPYWMRGFKDY